MLNCESTVNANEPSILSTYGYLKPVRVQSNSDTNTIFIYPRNNSEPDAEEVFESFQIHEKGFSLILGSVDGLIYKGRTSAGGYGEQLDINSDGKPDLFFSEKCNFIVQLDGEEYRAIEADRDIKVTIGGEQVSLEASVPYYLTEVTY